MENKYMKRTHALVLVMSLILLTFLHREGLSQSVDRVGTVVGGRANELNAFLLKDEITENLGLPAIHKDLGDINQTLTETFDKEIENLLKYIEEFKPREEVITVTVYRNSSESGDDGGGSGNSTWDHGGDDGGDGGSSGSDSGNSGGTGGSGGDNGGC